MNKISKIKNLSLMYDEYKNLLTNNQKNVFIKYFFEDLSLQEIAIELNISKSAVSDNLKTIEQKLLKWEDKLHLVSRRQKLNKILEIIDDEDIINKLNNI